MQDIKNIIFDLGGVILDIDYNKTVKAFEKLGISSVNNQFIQSSQIDFINEFEKGLKNKNDFYGYVNNIQPLDTNEIDEAWNAMLLEIPLRRLQILQQLNLHYNTFLLSNTNEIHEICFNQKLKRVCGMDNFSYFFNKMYMSHHVGMRKPDTAIFNMILQENNLKASETLFIDDSIQHIEAAKLIGIRTIHLQNETIENIFRNKNSAL